MQVIRVVYKKNPKRKTTVLGYVETEDGKQVLIGEWLKQNPEVEVDWLSIPHIHED